MNNIKKCTDYTKRDIPLPKLERHLEFLGKQYGRGFQQDIINYENKKQKHL